MTELCGMGKSARGLAQSKTLREVLERTKIRQVLDCASPLALFIPQALMRKMDSHLGAIWELQLPVRTGATRPIRRWLWADNFS